MSCLHIVYLQREWISALLLSDCGQWFCPVFLHLELVVSAHVVPGTPVLFVVEKWNCILLSL